VSLQVFSQFCGDEVGGAPFARRQAVSRLHLAVDKRVTAFQSRMCVHVG